MPSVQVKDFPQELYDELKAYAELNHRSMAQQLIVAAEQMLSQAATHARTPESPTAENDEQSRLARIAKRQAVFARIDASAEESKRNSICTEGKLDPAELVREDRDGGAEPTATRMEASS